MGIDFTGNIIFGFEYNEVVGVDYEEVESIRYNETTGIPYAKKEQVKYQTLFGRRVEDLDNSLAESQLEEVYIKQGEIYVGRKFSQTRSNRSGGEARYISLENFLREYNEVEKLFRDAGYEGSVYIINALGVC